MANVLAKLTGVSVEDISKALLADASRHAAEGLYLERLWQNADNAGEVYFLFRTEDLEHAKRFVEKVHAEARKENPDAKLPQMTFLEEQTDMILDASIKRFFSEYESSFSELDLEKQAGMFADTFISAGPKGAIAESKDQFLEMAEKAVEFYGTVGQEYVKILSLSETPISNEYSMVKVHWGAKFQKTGDKLIEFDVSYLLQKIGEELKIILFIAHQDEQKAMEELGLL